MSNPWFRMYSDFIHDEKIEFISFEDQRHFVFVLCMKNLGLIDKEYSNPEMLDRVVARRLGLYGEAFDSAKKRLLESGLIDSDWNPVNWNKRQFISDLDPTNAQRQRKSRDKKRNLNSNALRNGPVTVLDTETDTEEDKDIKPSSKGTRLDPDLELNVGFQYAALGIRAIDPDELQEVFAKFKDYWIAVPGSKGVKLDWLATWRNWVRGTKTTAAVTQHRPLYENT